jgi:hypothetical protein
VSTPVPEVVRHAEWCEIGASADDLELAIARAIAEDSPEDRRARSEAMVNETWASRVAQVARTVDDLAARVKRTA